MVIAVTAIFMLLNAFLPLNFSHLKTETTYYPFKLTMSLEKITYSLREPINIILYLENIGNESVTLEYPSPSHFDSIICDENFNQVYGLGEHRGWVTLWLPPHEIEPGETINTTLTWYQEVGFKRVEPGVIYYYWAKPGIYYVTGIFTSATYNVTLNTPAIRITIGE
jgi:hypothetical protein